MGSFLLAIDQGTTGSTAVVVAPDARLLGKATREFPQHFPEPGWVEHDLAELRASVVDSIGEALKVAGVTSSDCVGIGITNQRETTVLWDRKTGEAVHRAIVWQDRRTAARCAQLKGLGLEEQVRARTGLVLDPYFSGTKLEWLLDHVPNARARAERGELAFGTIDSWLLWQLTGGKVHATDPSNASRTLLYDIHQGQWDASLLEMLRVPSGVLPTVRSSSEKYGVTAGFAGLADGIPIAGIAGDQQAALFGQTCFDVGDAKCTYGTGAFLLMNTGAKPVSSQNGLLTTVAWRIGDQVTYALEGSTFIAGAAVQWLRDGLGLIRSASEIEALAMTVPSTGEVVFVPALAGLSAPHWDPNARGLICGLSRDTTAAHLARATLEGIAFQVADLLAAFKSDASENVTRLRVDGGASLNRLLMQFQSDILASEIDRPASVETTALGAVYLAGLATGVFKNLTDIRKAHRIDATFRPSMATADREAALRKWSGAVARTRSEQKS